MSRSLLSFTTVLTVGGALLMVGCGGSTLPRVALPRADAVLLENAPRDAFFVARFDGQALRRLANWPELDAALETGDAHLREAIRGTDMLYVAVGGLIDAPIPANSDSGEEGDPVYERREWADLSRAFGGRIPAAVAVVQGTVAGICETALQRAEVREEGGYRYGSRNGVTIALRGSNLCLVTFEPVMQHLLHGGTGTSPAAGRLTALARGDDLGFASAAIELDSPAFQGLIDAMGTDLDSQSDESRRLATMARRIYRSVMSGVDAVEWRAGADGTRYTSDTRVQASDEGRAVMWREATEIYFEILKAVADANVVPEEGREHFRTLVSDTHVDEARDGFVIRATIDQQTVTSIFRSIAPSSVSEATEVQTDTESDLVYQMSSSAREIIDLVEPRASELNSLRSYDRFLVETRLADAYAAVGRFDDAARVLTSNIDAMTESFDTQYAVQARIKLVRLQLSTGHVAEAEAAIADAITACESSYCGVESTRLQILLAEALAQRGDVAGARAKLADIQVVDDGSMESVEISAAEIRLMIMEGQNAEAASLARLLCASRVSYAPCNEVQFLEAEALARSNGPIAVFQAAIARAREHAAGESAMAIDDDALRGRLAECVAMVSRSPGTTATVSTCREVVETFVATHGELHPTTARARLEYARALTASRDTAGAAAQLAKVDATIATLGPFHALRRARTARTPARR